MRSETCIQYSLSVGDRKSLVNIEINSMSIKLKVVPTMFFTQTEVFEYGEMDKFYEYF